MKSALRFHEHRLGPPPAARRPPRTARLLGPLRPSSDGASRGHRPRPARAPRRTPVPGGGPHPSPPRSEEPACRDPPRSPADYRPQLPRRAKPQMPPQVAQAGQPCRAPHRPLPLPAQRRSGADALSARRRVPPRLLEPAGRRRWRRRAAGATASSRTRSAPAGGRGRSSRPRASTSSARSAIATWPNAVGWTASTITRLRAPKSRRSQTSAPCLAAARSIAPFASSTAAPARGRPRSSGSVQTSRRSQRRSRNASASQRSRS